MADRRGSPRLGRDNFQAHSEKENVMRKVLEIGGFIAAIVLICFGVASIVMGVNGRSTVQSTLKQEQIVGTPDMTPNAIRAEAKDAGLSSSISLPTESVAGLPINSGERARAFASYMRIHALEATGGLTYAQMPRFATTDGKGTNDPTLALKGDNGQPVDNPLRQVWVTETALSTALNTSYMADRLSLFGIVVGIALLLSGIGFGVLALGGALRNRESALGFLKHEEPRQTIAKPMVPTT
jgi:F0F1-type ATP synthase membrane subunit c/vacuolar-type H+-ATPase subunit K